MTYARSKLIGVIGLALVVLGGNTALADSKQDFRSDVLYRSACAPCHGVTGAGNGPVASAIRGGVPRLDDLAKRYSHEYPADYVRQTIDGRMDILSHGSSDMPIWGLRFMLYNNAMGLTGEQADESAEAASQMLIDALVEYVATLQTE